MRVAQATSEALAQENGRRSFRSQYQGYGIAIAGVIVMAVVRLSLNPWLEEQSRFIVFLPAIMLASWYGGMRSALLALTLGAGFGIYISLSVPHSPASTLGDLLGLVLYLMASIMVLVVNDKQRRETLRAEENRQVAEQAQALLIARQSQIENLNLQLQQAMTETYHRVKNNLQVISSLVNLQIQEGDKPVPIDALRRLNQHVQALVGINDLLTQQTRQEGMASRLPSTSTIDKLLALIPATIGDRHIRCDVEPIPLTIKQGTALALLINEIISNAVKHGTGDIDLAILQRDRMVRLEVSDDGPGFPAGFDAETTGNTGLELVEQLARWDLRGTIAYENRILGGARVVVTFPVAGETQEDSDQSPQVTGRPVGPDPYVNSSTLK